MQQHVKIIGEICRIIENSKTTPSLASLARHAGMSDYYFHRVFKSVTGVTPKHYASEHRAKSVRKKLLKDNSITDAIYNAGFGSNSRFYEKSDRLLGMTPSQYKTGGLNTHIKFAIGECSLGSVLVAATEKGVCAILLGDNPDALLMDLQDCFSKSDISGGDKKFEKMVAKIVGYIDNPGKNIGLPLDIQGTAFQRKVWNALGKIPTGKTISYSELAKIIGKPGAARAVAGACAKNKLAVAIPCHRVVRNDGSLSGYRWGIERKSKLLELETGVKYKK